jgi:hypothetical protein
VFVEWFSVENVSETSVPCFSIYLFVRLKGTVKSPTGLVHEESVSLKKGPACALILRDL